MPSFSEHSRAIAQSMGLNLSDLSQIESIDHHLKRGARLFVVRDGSGPIANPPRVLQDGFVSLDAAKRVCEAWRRDHAVLWQVGNDGKAAPLADTAIVALDRGQGNVQISELESTIAGLRKDLAGQVKITEDLQARIQNQKTTIGKLSDPPVGYLAIGPYTWGRGDTAIEAARALLKAGCLRTDRFYLQAYIGDDKPEVDGGGMVSRKTGTRVLTLGYFKSLGAYLRNDCPPAKKAA